MRAQRQLSRAFCGRPYCLSRSRPAWVYQMCQGHCLSGRPLIAERGMWEQLDGLTYIKGRSRFWSSLYCSSAICPEGQIQTQQPCLATATSSCGLPPSGFHRTRPSNMSWGAPWNDTHDLSQPSWSSGAGNWASDHWQDSIWSGECDKRKGPASDKQRRPNLPHVTTLGLKHPLPLDER